MPDQTVRFCNKCSRQFTFFLRKHHCRMCESIFCNKCSKMKMMKFEGRVQKIRICSNCEKLDKNFKQEKKDNKKIMTADEAFVDDRTDQKFSKYQKY